MGKNHLTRGRTMAQSAEPANNWTIHPSSPRRWGVMSHYVQRACLTNKKDNTFPISANNFSEQYSRRQLWSVKADILYFSNERNAFRSIKPARNRSSIWECPWEERDRENVQLCEFPVILIWYVWHCFVEYSFLPLGFGGISGSYLTAETG